MINRQVKMLLITVVILFVITACNTEEDQDTNNEKQDILASEEDSSPTNSAETDDTENVEDNQTDQLIVPKAGIQKKDEGEEVLSLQQALNSIGYDIAEDRTFDAETTWAITDLQLQQDSLMATGVFDKDTKQVLETLITNKHTVQPGEGLEKKTETVTTDYGSTILANPYDQLALINKQHALPSDYIPEDLVIPDVRFPFPEDYPKKQMREVAANALEELFKAAEEEGYYLYAQSGYRAYDTQQSLFASYVEDHGEQEANTFSARPGESEHQSGLTMDITSESAEFLLNETFGKTEEGKWVEENAAEYGFIIRYPRGKEEVTEYQYEPWHIRYVGKKAAVEIMEKGMTLEEYLK
ncbi:D-alanyl-D-alanine carboxypeptidase family protein [Oceanobacillus halotolerans]|uniref:D-alanyl-D-alanine carboxypeptidase family protein n=1 Tax=Oceanobacillus halotolerans TaxID=2663380 RepID=UPI0013DB0485|nr:D-alanyl-D-alanine carboxypeptidase family protein [Oceanobacillus halotolerans]